MKSFKKFISEARRFELGDRVKLTGKSEQQQKKHGIAVTGKIIKKHRSSGKDYFQVGWDDGHHSGTFHLQSRLGIDITKE